MTADEFVLICLALGIIAVPIRAVIVSRRKGLREARIAQEKRQEKERQARERKERDEREQQRIENETRNELNAIVQAATAIFNRSGDVVGKFLTIAESKVSILDEYGDENWEALPNEIKLCLKKIANREHLDIDWNLIDERKAREFGQLFRTKDPMGLLAARLQLTLQRPNAEMSIYWLYNRLEDDFKEHHLACAETSVVSTDIAALSGVEFEIYIARILKQFGYHVSGTPTTGNQGADLIAERDGKKVIIQAKRYEGTVGNKAVQEVSGAVSFYGGDEGWVVTNSTFTASAKALAQKTNVRLIDGMRLAAMEKLIEQG